MVVCVGYCEVAADAAATTRRSASPATACSAGTARCTSRPARRRAYAAGDRFAAFDTPVGRLGMLIDYDKTFPEAARTLAARRRADRSPACRPGRRASPTAPPRLAQDRQSRLFDLYDCARAAENQVVLVSSNQTGAMGGLRFLGQAKVVGPGGDVLARTWAKAGLAVAELDVDGRDRPGPAGAVPPRRARGRTTLRR